MAVHKKNAFTIHYFQDFKYY